MRASYDVIPTHGHQPPAAPHGDDEAESTMQLGPIARDVRTLERFFQGTGYLNVPAEEEAEKKKGGEEIKVALSTGFGGMEVDLAVKNFLESKSENKLWNICNVQNVTENVHETMDLRMIGKTYMAYAKRYFIEMNGRSSTKGLLRANEDRALLRETVDAILGENDVWVLPTCPVGVAFPHNPMQGRMP